MVCIRSSLGSKGIILPNAPGIIDSDYRGEVMVLMLNMSTDPLTLVPGDRIAQMVILKCSMEQPKLANLTATDRGEGGFGSTGTR